MTTYALITRALELAALTAPDQGERSTLTAVRVELRRRKVLVA